MEIRKNTKNLGEIIVKPVSKEIAKKIILKNHYSHKWVSNFGVYNYGIFRAEEPNKCLGVAAYGYVKNLNGRMFEHPNPNAWMIELNRMWIDDCLGYNAETVLIGASLRMLKKSQQKYCSGTIIRRRTARMRHDL